MSIELCKSAGFCFGVRRAVESSIKLAKEHQKVYTLGPIIHNRFAVADLEKCGVRVVERVEDCPKDALLIIRSHGVPLQTIQQIRENNISYFDATCPFVANIQKAARQAGEEGKCFVIVGDKNHPEVVGILGHCMSEKYAVSG